MNHKQELIRVMCDVNKTIDEINKSTNEISKEINKLTRTKSGYKFLAEEYKVPTDVIVYYHKKYKKLPFYHYGNGEEKTKAYDLLKLLEREMKIRKLKRNSRFYIFRKLFNKLRIK